MIERRPELIQWSASDGELLRGQMFGSGSETLLSELTGAKTPSPSGTTTKGFILDGFLQNHLPVNPPRLVLIQISNTDVHQVNQRSDNS